MAEYDLKTLSDMPLYGDDWTDANQSRLYDWKRDCIRCAELHHEKLRREKKTFVIVKCSALLFTVLTGMFLAFHERYPGTNLSDVAIATSAIASLLGGIDLLMSPQEKYMGHKQGKSAYLNIARTIDYLCSLPPKKRPDVEVAYVIVTGEMNNIDTSAPPIPLFSIREESFQDLMSSRGQ